MAFHKKTYSLRRMLADVAALVARAGDVMDVNTGMDPALREQVMLAVARSNECRYCVFAHTDAGRHAGLTDADLARVEAMDPAGFAPGVWAAIAYACALAQADFGPVDAELAAAVLDSYGEDGRRRVETAARVMTVANLTGNTADALFSRLRGDPAPDARVCDEVVITSVWLAGAAATVFNILRERPRSPLGLLAEFRDSDAAAV